MRARLVATLSVSLGLLVLLPFAIVVVLGTYGSAIGGSSQSVANSGATLTIIPAEGLPGSVVRVEGRRWPPRTEVSLSVSRGGDDGTDRQMRVARVAVSRNGTFVTAIAVPATIVGPNTKSLRIAAESGVTGQSVAESSVVDFKIAPYPNQVRVRVTDTETSFPLRKTIVEVSDLFGEIIAVGYTNLDGDITFANLTPGRLRLEGRRLDYLRGRIEFESPDSGIADIEIALAPYPEQRLYMPFIYPDAGGNLRVAGVDRASGMRSDLTLARRVQAAWLPDMPDGPHFQYFFLIPEGTPSTGDPSNSGAAERLIC